MTRAAGPAVPAEMTLAPGRVHEVEGPGRRAFALWQAARRPGPVVWILPAHAPERPLPAGLPRGLAERLLLVPARGETELLWAAEEALRAPAVALVAAEPERPLGLTAGRRLQLAAGAGGATGLMLIHGGAGGATAETRWRCAPLPAEVDSTLHRWSLIKNKKGTLGDWTLRWDGTTAALHLVPAARDRCGPEDSAL